MFDEIRKEYINLMNDGKLPYIKCKSCGYVFFYPRDYCPKCDSKDLEIKVSKGEGKVFSITMFQSAKGKIYYGIIELDEGFRMYANIEDDAEIGDKVTVEFTEKDGRKIPIFRRS
ncbi:zinc ribbon domain-containing protein [Acidianus sp. HS-5]|uniref:Zn-ribbon domain-containing OB-fold protein n=1 Tax=Acidianus sp. HS-5 TaxID=2886040 RepID=UPI001F168434|nr:zinc ribbon domain-containing protein [Acidianus sp. HS-5]BDC18830.1 hypothetical protein HS5_17200 [Acidianus sp. HS-5]